MLEIKFGFTAKQIIQEGRTSEEAIQQIKIWLSPQNLPSLTNEQIVLFLLSCDNDQETTKTTLTTFYSIKRKTPEIFDNRRLDRSDLQKSFDVDHIFLIPKLTDDGCAIIINRINDTNYRNVDVRAYLTQLSMTTEAAVYDYPPKGLIILCDMKGVSLMRLTTIRLGLFKAYLHYLQEGLPVKLKNVHMMNSFYVIDKLMIIARPFLKSAVMEKAQFHPVGMDMESFHKQWVPKHCLPEDYGGDLPSSKILHERHIQNMAKMQSYFDAEEQQRYSIIK